MYNMISVCGQPKTTTTTDAICLPLFCNCTLNLTLTYTKYKRMGLRIEIETCSLPLPKAEVSIFLFTASQITNHNSPLLVDAEFSIRQSVCLSPLHAAVCAYVQWYFMHKMVCNGMYCTLYQQQQLFELSALTLVLVWAIYSMLHNMYVRQKRVEIIQRYIHNVYVHGHRALLCSGLCEVWIQKRTTDNRTYNRNQVTASLFIPHICIFILHLTALSFQYYIYPSISHH
jgi:hypothetical protein